MQPNPKNPTLEQQENEEEVGKAKGFTWNTSMSCINTCIGGGYPSALSNPSFDNDILNLFVNSNNADLSLLPNNFCNSHKTHESIPQALNSHGLVETSLLHEMEPSLDYAVYDTNPIEPFLGKPKSYLSSVLSSVCNDPLDDSLGMAGNGSDLFEPLNQNHTSALNSPLLMALNCLNSVDSSTLSFISQNSGTQLLPLIDDSGDVSFNNGLSPMGVDFHENSTPYPLFLNRTKTMKPSSISSDLNLFQKALDMSRNLGRNGGEYGSLYEENSPLSIGLSSDKGKGLIEEEYSFMMNKKTGEVGKDSASVLKLDSEEPRESYMLFSDANNDVEIQNEGQKRRAPAKNLMAERRRRKKLNDRLYMLRSVVPKISKMDRTSILADTIDYMKELLQKVKILGDELQSLSSGSSLPPSASIKHPQFSGSAPYYVKEEIRKSLPVPTDQPPTVHVEVSKENAFNIHMLCTRRPGLLLSSIRTLENLGLDVQQAVISCFNGFSLDVFCAEKCDGGLGTQTDQIRAALLDTAAFHGLM